MRDRRSTYDITDDVQLTDADSVLKAVCTIFRGAFTQFNENALKQAFDDCDRLFAGNYSSYLPCDTLYHDKQHSMDMTLALIARLFGQEVAETAASYAEYTWHRDAEHDPFAADLNVMARAMGLVE